VTALLPRRRYALPLPPRAGDAPLGASSRELLLGERTVVMGIVNVTPDSFADGGLRFDAARAIDDGLQMIEDGAGILDVGGESTRPGAEPLGEGEELRRVIPVIEKLAASGRAVVSVDTYKARVAREAVAAGADIVNDISGLQFDPELGGTVAETGAALVLMHTRGRPRDMHREARYGDVVSEVAAELQQAIARATAAGVGRDAIVVDPGIGFAKRAVHSYRALAGLPRLAALDRPILVGPSRKSFLTAALGDLPPSGREWGTAAAVAAAVLFGAHIVRVHGVREMAEVARVSDAIRDQGESG
jgi:dihydropteroate synthase